MENAPPATAHRGKNRDPEAEIQRILAILHRWGIDTIGRLAALPREQLRTRLGREAVRLWERAQGQSTRLLQWVQFPESFRENFEFEHEIETAEPLLFMLRRFLQQLALRLNGIYLVAHELALQISFADKTSYECRFQIPEPTNEVDLLFRMLQTHLEDFKSEHPIVAVSLEAHPIRLAPQQFGLFETALRNPHRLYETLARLGSLLGKDRVGRPVLEETHRPDAFRMEPFIWKLTSIMDTGGPSSATPGSYPQICRNSPLHILGPVLRRFRPGAFGSVLLDKKRPAHIRSLEIFGKIMDQRGPYFISGNWWDEKAWERAEWDLELENGTVCRCHQSSEQWEIDGVYD
jgi:impB/mucB/samB family C-terminal domain